MYMNKRMIYVVINPQMSCLLGIDDVRDVKDPLSKVKAGLVSSGDDQVPLKSVHIRAKLLDLSAQVCSSCFNDFMRILLTRNNLTISLPILVVIGYSNFESGDQID